MAGSGWVRGAVVALLGAALVVLGPTSDASAVGTITITGTVTSPAGGSFDYLRVDGPNGFEYFDNGTPDGTFSLTGQPGDYTVYVGQYGSTATGSWSFYGQTAPVTFATDGVLNASLPLHTLALQVRKPNNTPAPSSVQVTCDNLTPSGWAYSYSTGYGNNGGDTSLFVANAASASQDCALRVEPVSGPIRKARIPGNASTYTHVVAPGVHVAGTLSDGLGHPAADTQVLAYDDADGQVSGYATTDATGHYDLELDPGTHYLSVPYITSSADLQYRFSTEPLNVTANMSLNLAPVLDTLTVHARKVGAPLTTVASTASLYCSGTPEGQTLIVDQYTYVSKPAGTDFALSGAATGTDTCSLDLDPTVGVRLVQNVTVPNGGGDLTVPLDTGIGFTGQLTVPGTPGAPGIATFSNAQVTVAPDGHESDQVNVASNGSFSFAGVAAGDATVYADLIEPAWGNLHFQRRFTLAEGNNIALSPHLDYLDLYLLGPTGNDGTGTATLSCNGSRADDGNVFTSVTTTRSGTGTIRLPGYAADAQNCQLSVTWSDNTVVNRAVTLDPGADTQLTLLKNGVTFLSDPFTSNDDDGVADALEAYAPNVGDGNSDGNFDYLQADVSSLPEDGGALGSAEEYLTVAGPAGKPLASVSTAPIATPLPYDISLPDGAVDVTVDAVTPLSTQQFTIFAGPTAGIDGYASFDPATSTWSKLPAADVQIGPTSVTISVQDNGPFDRDPVAGRIRHPGGGTKTEVDLAAPTITFKGPVNGATYALGAVPAHTCTASDPGGSGVVSNACSVSVVGATSAGVGSLTMVATAVDRAGNVKKLAIHYKVIYKDNALSAPAAGSKPKIFKHGSTVVVRLKLLDARGSAVSPAKAPAWLAPKAKGTSTGKVNQKVNTAKPDKGSVLIKRGSYWEYRWSTAKAKKGKAYVIKVRLDDGTTRTVTVGIG